MVADACLVSPGIIGSLCRPGSAQRVRVCDMWRSAVTCLLACRLISLSCRGFTRKDSSPEGRLCRPDNLNDVEAASGGGREGGLPVGCKRRIRPLTRDAVNLPRSPVWAVRSRSCSFESCFDSLASVRPQMRRMSRSRCCVISSRCSSARWHDLGSPLPIARCSRHLHGCFLVSVGLRSSSRQRRCCVGIASSWLGTGRSRAAMLLRTTRSIPTLWHSSFASPVRIPGGAISASSASCRAPKPRAPKPRSTVRPR